MDVIVLLCLQRQKAQADTHASKRSSKASNVGVRPCVPDARLSLHHTEPAAHTHPQPNTGTRGFSWHGVRGGHVEQ